MGTDNQGGGPGRFVLAESSLPQQQNPGSETTYPGYEEAFQAVRAFVPPEKMAGVIPPSPENPIVYAIGPGTGTPRQVAEGVPVAIPSVAESGGLVEKGRTKIGEGVHVITLGRPVSPDEEMQGYSEDLLPYTEPKTDK